ncbi:THUMP domain-containing class I SAM-dependent RNA methyltransferase [Rhodovulum sp. DZ06]|uniref:THUMP domain-containing class I SAM-dependent RNA methyltransferase n=1 Tax=Rhodovulum sp. DZ06 TaxID=3425126 RepID=UPI003D3279B7
MTDSAPLDIFLAVPPGLETLLAEEAAAAGFAPATPVPGGVEVQGSWEDAWRANLVLRGPSRVLVRLGGFRAMHLAQLDKRARKFPWGDVLRPGAPLRIEAVCRKSRIYHDRAAAQRVAAAISETLGAPIATPGAEGEGAEGDALRLQVRIEDDWCSFSIDTSGALLHKRGFKHAVGKAPMRENMAALFLRRCGFDGSAPVLDPMCGSGGFVIEAAEMAAGLVPGRARGFAFERLASFDRDAWEALRARHAATPADPWEGPLFYGSDRDAGAVRGALQNAERAGVAPLCRFREKPAGSIKPPEGAPGLVIVNPPYGARIGEVRKLRPLYGTLGKTLAERFKGWRVGIVTSEAQLARATGLPFGEPDAPVAHGGLKVRLWRTGPLA